MIVTVGPPACSAAFWLITIVFIVSPGEQAVGVPAQRKGNPSDYRRRERQETGRQAGQQLNWPHNSLAHGFQINCYLQNRAAVSVCSLKLVGNQASDTQPRGSKGVGNHRGGWRNLQTGGAVQRLHSATYCTCSVASHPEAVYSVPVCVKPRLMLNRKFGFLYVAVLCPCYNNQIRVMVDL